MSNKIGLDLEIAGRAIVLHNVEGLKCIGCNKDLLPKDTQGIIDLKYKQLGSHALVFCHNLACLELYTETRKK